MFSLFFLQEWTSWKLYYQLYQKHLKRIQKWGELIVEIFLDSGNVINEKKDVLLSVWS